MVIIRDAIYVALLLFASPLLIWSALRHGKYRAGWSQKLLGRVPLRTGESRCVWFHAVSVGEIRVLGRLVDHFRSRFPDWEVVISTTTLTGYQVAEQQFPNETLFYCPLDFSWAVRRAMSRVRPDLFVLAELEVWPNLIRAAKRAGAKTALINGRLSDSSFRGYQKAGWLLRSTFASFDYVGTQSQEYLDRFAALGVNTNGLEQTGSLKFDGVESDRTLPQFAELRRLAGIGANDRIWLAGSTQPEEDALVLAAFESLAKKWPDLRLILVPRHPERFDEAERRIEASGQPYLRRTRLSGGRSKEGQRPSAGASQAHESARWRVLLVDTVGELGRWWASAEIAYVGGSMGRRGGQNMIEPAAFGAAVSFGPSTANFRDVVRLFRSRDAAVVVSDREEMESFVEKCLAKPDFVSSIGSRARRLVAEQQGASMVTIDGLARLVGESGGEHDSEEGGKIAHDLDSDQSNSRGVAAA